MLFLAAQLQYRRREAIYIGKLKHNYDEIEHEYITGICSYQDLADKYGVNKTVLAQYAKKNDWVGKRAQYAYDVQIDLMKQKRAERVKTLSKICEAADLLVSVALKQAAKAIEDGGLTAQNAKFLTEALTNAEKVMRSAADMPTKIEQQKVDILKDKNKEDNIDKEIVVKFAPGPQAQQDQGGGGGD